MVASPYLQIFEYKLTHCESDLDLATLGLLCINVSYSFVMASSLIWSAYTGSKELSVSINDLRVSISWLFIILLPISVIWFNLLSINFLILASCVAWVVTVFLTIPLDIVCAIFDMFIKAFKWSLDIVRPPTGQKIRKKKIQCVHLDQASNYQIPSKPNDLGWMRQGPM